MFKLIRLLSLCVLLISLPVAAQWPGQDDPAIAAQRQKVFDAPFDQKAAHSAELLKLIEAKFGRTSAEYAQELQLHASNLGWVQKFTEAQQSNAEAVRILEKLPDSDAKTIAFAKRALAKSMQLNGFPDQAVEPFDDFITLMTDVAYECGRIEGMIIKGCSHSAIELGDFLVGYGVLLRDVGRSQDAVKRFEQVLARFEPRWTACETEEWGLKCDRATNERRSLLDDFAEFLEADGAMDRARKLRADNMLLWWEKLQSGEPEGMAKSYVMLTDYRKYRELLAKIDLPAMFALDEKWLAILAAQPPYARAETDEAEYFDENYRETMDKIILDFVERAIADGRIELANKVLAPMGKTDLVASRTVQTDYADRLEDIDGRLAALGYGDRDARIDLLLTKVELLKDWKGEGDDGYRQGVKDAGYELRRADRNQEAIAMFRRGYAAARKASGDGDFRSWYAVEPLVETLIKIGSTDEAIAILADLLEKPETDFMSVYEDPVQSAALGQSFVDPYEQLNGLKADYAELLLQNEGDASRALNAARHAATGMKAYRDSLGFSRLQQSRLDFLVNDPWSFLSQRRYREFHILHSDALWEAEGSEAFETAFLALQEASMGTTSRAVAKAAAERAAQRGGVGDLLVERDRLDAEIKTLEDENFGNSQDNTIAGTRHRQVQIAMREARQQLGLDKEHPLDSQQKRRAIRNAVARKNFRRTEINQEIARTTPGYFELVRPKPLSQEEATRLLSPGEAFLLVVPSQFGTHILLVTSNGIRWHRSDLGLESLNGHVRRLLWDVGANITVSDSENERWSAEGDGLFPFDRDTAHLLYNELVAPFVDDLSDTKHLFVSAQGALSSLPFSLFVTEEPIGVDGDADQLRATPWLADKFALVQLPSLQSLQLLRAVAAQDGEEAAKRMLGFGDPVLEGEAATRGVTASRRLTRASGLPVNLAFAGRTGEDVLADPDILRKMARLPGTAEELRAMEKLFGERQTELFLGDRATEARLKQTDLSDASLLFLATHGLVAGELAGVGEPGLVFTPPDEATKLDDGLLTASEVTALPINADWVILSACNTAAGDGRAGAPGLSGLARSFFFAGAESLLASHWPVRDDVAALMTVKLFELQNAHPDWSRAQALQAAMKEIRDDPRADDDLASWSHPSAWAPFTYIGDIR